LAGSDLTTLVKGEAVATIVNDDSSTWVSGTMADLGSGTVGTGAYVVDSFDGAVILQPRIANEFTGPTLPVGWTKGPGGTVTFTDGAAIVDGAQIQNTGGLYGNQTLEFAATFSGASQYMGTSQLKFQTKFDGKFYVTTLAPKGAAVEMLLPSSLLGSMHKFRIEWSPLGVVYLIDGAVVATHAVVYPSNTAMMAVGGDLGTGALVLDWVRTTPYQPSGDFTSAVFDAGEQVTFNTAEWVSEVPVGTLLSLQVRVGSTPTPDGSWSPFTPVSLSGGLIGHTGRYVQYQVVLTTTVPGSTPTLKDVVITYTR